MNNEMKIFNNEEFGTLRTVTIDGEVWFVGKDAAVALGYKDTSDALKKHVDSEDKLTRRFTDSGQSRQMYIINESGLYTLIFGSKLESAQKFKHWVTKDVLPALHLLNNRNSTEETQVTLFKNQEFGNMRTVIRNNIPYFCLSDLCRALGIGNASQVLTRLKSDGVITNEVIDTLNRKQQATFVNESNLYRLIFQSRKPSAERFTDWVTEDVLPTLRKTGTYSVSGSVNQNIALLAQGHMELVHELEEQRKDIDEIKERLNVVGAYDNEWMLQKIKTVTSARVMYLTVDPVNRVLWTRYFYAGIYSMLKATYRVASLSSIPVAEYESALTFINKWIPTSVFLQQRISDMQSKQTKNLLPDKKVIALLQYMQATNNGAINPFASL